MKFSIGSFALELVKQLSDAKNPFDLLLDEIRAVVREEIAVALTKGSRELLEPDELAERLQVPVSRVYEQCRQGNIPTHRIVKHIRFDLAEVLESQN
jgi:excisionase family DNA binding protein